jgi:glycerol-3-phosphate cytidylyltransferase
MIIGYTSGVYDLFHIGHLNLLKNAKGMCDKLIVGVTTDDLSLYKGKTPMIPFEERLEIVRNIKFVDAVVPQESMDKLSMCKKLKANILFVGDDWYNTPKWKHIENDLAEIGVSVVYFPYTKGISSTKIGQTLKSMRGWTSEDNVNG